MPRYYFELTENGRKYYKIDQTSTKSLSPEELKTIIDAMTTSKIFDIAPLNDNTINITFTNTMELILDKNFFHYKEYNPEVEALRNKIIAYTTELEKTRLENFSKRYNGYVPQINRHKSKNRKPMFVAISLAGAIFITGLGISLAKNSKNNQAEKEQIIISSENPEEPTYIADNVLSDIEPSFEVASEEIIEEPINTEPNIVIDYSFKNISQDGKLATTEEYLGDYVSYYSARWGLPTDLVLAQITQERPSIVDGNCKNPCQITYKYFIGETFKMPVYDANGFTGTYDEFTVSEASLNSNEGNIMAGIAYLRKCIDSTKSLFTGLYLYNQGEPSLRQACKYYNYNIDDYKGDANSLAACELITTYNREVHGQNYGDYNYLANVFRYLPTSDRGNEVLSYYSGEEKINIELNNTLLYNSELSR